MQFEARCVDTDSLLDRVGELAEALRGLWQGVMTIRTHEDRAAAIAGARSVMIEIEHYMEQVSMEINRTEEASAKLGTSFRPAMSRFANAQTRRRRPAEEGGL